MNTKLGEIKYNLCKVGQLDLADALGPKSTPVREMAHVIKCTRNLIAINSCRRSLIYEGTCRETERFKLSSFVPRLAHVVMYMA